MVIPRDSAGPHVGSQVVLAFQKSRAAVAEPQSTHGLPPTESLRWKLAVLFAGGFETERGVRAWGGLTGSTLRFLRLLR
jgi:hypothetical protein